MHGYEIEYAFGQPYWRPHLYDQTHLEDEKRLSSIIMQIWANFANTGLVFEYSQELSGADKLVPADILAVFRYSQHLILPV